jgi:hypothetical protein
VQKRKIVIEFKSDAPLDVVDRVADDMFAQLESLNDGTLIMNEGEDAVDYKCYMLSCEVHTVYGSDEEESE